MGNTCIWCGGGLTGQNHRISVWRKHFFTRKMFLLAHNLIFHFITNVLTEKEREKKNATKILGNTNV